MVPGWNCATPLPAREGSRTFATARKQPPPRALAAPPAWQDAPMPLAIESIGAEAQPLCILDDFAPGPEALREFAKAARFGEATPSTVKSRPAVSTRLLQQSGNRLTWC